MDKSVFRMRIALGVGLALIVPALTCGCETPVVPVSLSYQVADNEKVTASLSGWRVTLTPFQDVRTDKFIYGKHLVLAEGQDAGVWVANALKLELEHAGAEVEPLAAGETPASGCHLTGQVAVLQSEGTGWAPGGLLSILVGTGYQPQIVLSVQLTEEGIPLLSRQFDLKRNVPSSPAALMLRGRPWPAEDVPPAFAVVLKELIQKQITPEITKCVQTADQSASKGGQP